MATYLVNILLHDKINSNCPVLCEVIQIAKGVNYLSHTQVFKWGTMARNMVSLDPACYQMGGW